VADGFDTDFSELTKLSVDLGTVGKLAGPFINSAIKVTSGKVKKDAQRTAGKGNRRWRALPAGIDYEVKVEMGVGGSSITSEIGYDKDRAEVAKLGNIREFGSSRVSPHNDLLNALHKNEDDFVEGLVIATKDAEKAAGL